MTSKLPTPRDRDEALTLIGAAIYEARAVLQPWECDGLHALVAQYAASSPRAAGDHQRHASPPEAIAACSAGVRVRNWEITRPTVGPTTVEFTLDVDEQSTPEPIELNVRIEPWRSR